MLNAPQVNELTPEEVMRMGKEWFDSLLENIPADEVMIHYKPEQRLAGLTEEQRLAGLTEEQRLAGLTEEQIRAYLERLQQSKSSIN
jgi:predicted nucleotidyltransferase